jgi:hypothetical protein
MNWKHVTVRQYQQLVEIGKMDLSEDDATTEAIAALSGMTINEVRKLPQATRLKWRNRIQFINDPIKPKPKRYIKVNGRVYANDIDVKRMPCARYIECKYFGQDIIGNMHKLSAVMVRPLKRTWIGYKRLEYDTLNFPIYCEDMLDAPVEVALGVMVFFCLRSKILMMNLQDYLANQVRSKTMTATQSEVIFIRFKNNMDGFIRQLWSHSTTISHWKPRINYPQSNF